MANEEAETRQVLQDLGRFIETVLGDENGFILFVFPFGEDPDRRANYVSNAQREDAFNLVKEWLGRWEYHFDSPNDSPNKTPKVS